MRVVAEPLRPVVELEGRDVELGVGGHVADCREREREGFCVEIRVKIESLTVGAGGAVQHLDLIVQRHVVEQGGGARQRVVLRDRER
jgi:hypothetical protein